MQYMCIFMIYLSFFACYVCIYYIIILFGKFIKYNILVKIKKRTKEVSSAIVIAQLCAYILICFILYACIQYA